MGLLVAILVVAALLAGFLWVSFLERKHGRRIAEPLRARLDRGVNSLTGSLSSQEGRAGFGEALHRVFDYVVHEIAHGVLVAVRFAERTLSRVVREIRGRRTKDSVE